MKYLYVVLLFILHSCANDRCYSVPEIQVSDIVLGSANIRAYDYCGLLERSVEKDEKSILKLSLLDFDGEGFYSHGYVLVQLISFIGEHEYLKAIRNVSSEDRLLIDLYLRSGMEYGEILMGYGESKFKNSTLEKEFPLVAKFLEN